MAKAGINLRLVALEEWLRFIKSGASKENYRGNKKNVFLGITGQGKKDVESIKTDENEK